MIQDRYLSDNIKLFIQEQNDMYAEHINSLVKPALNAKKDLEINGKSLLSKVQDLALPEQERVLYAFDLIESFELLRHFSTSNIKQAFPKEFALSSIPLMWFINSDRIKRSIDDINSNDNLYLPPYSAYLIISNHILFKMLNSFLEAYGLTGSVQGISMNRFAKFFADEQRSQRDYERRGLNKLEVLQLKKDTGKNKEKLGYSKTLLSLTTIGQQLYNESNSAFDVFRGNTEKHQLNLLFESIILFPESAIGKEELFRKVFPLFQLIMPDKHFKTESEIEDSRSYHGYGQYLRQTLGGYLNLD